MEQVKQDKICLLITGTVVPNSNFVVHADPQARLQEYYESLQFYTDLMPGIPMYFLENSAYDFAADKKFQELLAQRKITLLKFPVSDKFNQGKGYQEFDMLDKAITELSSQFDGFVKITGRYKVHNLPRLISPPRRDLMADCHKKPRVVQTNVFYVSGKFYRQHLKGLYQQVDDSQGIYIEKLVYKKLNENNLFGQVQLFRSNPVITGTSGSYGGTLRRNRIKMILRNMERAMLRLAGVNQFLVEY